MWDINWCVNVVISKEEIRHWNVVISKEEIPHWDVVDSILSSDFMYKTILMWVDKSSYNLEGQCKKKLCLIDRRNLLSYEMMT